jgi:hypothetical protein
MSSEEWAAHSPNDNEARAMRAALGAVADRWKKPSEAMWRESSIHNRLGCEAVWSAMLTQAVREVE